MLDVVHRIDQLAAQQVQRCLAVERDVVERVGQDLVIQARPVCTLAMKKSWTVRNSSPPTPTASHISATCSMNSAAALGRRENTEKGRAGEQQQRRQGPDGHQHHLALEIVADLDFFLVVVARLVDVVVVARLEEKVPALAAGHADEPRQEHRDRRMLEDQEVRADEAGRAQQVERLIDAAVVVVAVVVPALLPEGFKEILPFVVVSRSLVDELGWGMRLTATLAGALPKRMTEKWPKGGTGWRSMSVMSCSLAASQPSKRLQGKSERQPKRLATGWKRRSKARRGPAVRADAVEQNDLAAGAQHPGKFFQRFFRVGHGVDDALRGHHVEEIVRDSPAARSP